jgi:hypothetical protein
MACRLPGTLCLHMAMPITQQDSCRPVMRVGRDSMESAIAPGQPRAFHDVGG